jgi:uncharacterized surface protein with fasciclin (FAS1) repeats
MSSKMLMTFGVGLSLLVSAPVASAQMANDHDMAAKDIVEVAAEAGTFNTLIAAAQAADLVDALKGEGPLTVFAPTDEAFAKLPEGTVKTLLKPENKAKLQAVLLYHVVEGKVTSNEVVNLSSAKTLEGDTVDISVKKGKVYIDEAQVIAADVEASNGVIHVIDAVLLPSMD